MKNENMFYFETFKNPVLLTQGCSMTGFDVESLCILRDIVGVVGLSVVGV